MYSTSATFQTKIKDVIRGIHWSGTIQTPTPISFNDSNIISGTLTRSISGESLEVGTVYSSQLSLEVDLPSVSRYELYGCEIELNMTLDGATDTVPMGVFTITEALQSASKITITAFDSMIKFDDVTFNPSSYTSIQTAYNWLNAMCTACGVTLGNTSAQIGVLPNGLRKVGYADVVSDVTSWRDVLGYLTAFLGGYAYIGRDDKLYIGSYSSASSDTVPSNFRFTSNLSDFRTTYDGLTAIYKGDGVQEYVSNSNSGGIVLNLGVNPFLQITDQSNRLDALQEIIDAWDGIYYVPYDSDMPLMPQYDPGDVLTFTDNQAGAYDIGAITEITYNIGGTMHVLCSGDNPRLAEAQDRFTKTVEGLANEYNNGQTIGGKDFWILITTNTSSLTVGSTKTEVAEIEFNQTTDHQKVGLMFTCDGTLSATATINLEINIDDDVSYTFEVTEEKSMKGKRFYSSNCGFTVDGKTLHTAKVYLTVTDNPTLWSDLV